MRNQILRAFLLGSAFVGLSLSASAQRPFRVSGNIITKTGNTVDPTSSEVMIYNTADRDFTLLWKRIYNDFPGEWDYSLCDNGNCQIGVPESGNTGIVKKGGNGFLMLTINPFGHADTGTMRFVVYEDQKPEEGDTITFVVTLGGTSAIDESASATPATTVTAWPNPARDRMRVATPSALPVQSAMAIDATGRTWNCPVLESSAAGTDFATQSLPAGVYMLRFVQGNAVYSARFVKE